MGRDDAAGGAPSAGGPAGSEPAGSEPAGSEPAGSELASLDWSLDDAEVRAAGGIVWRNGADGSVEVAVVHRPRYDDWSFAKGKLEPGESFEQAAVRELAEETGLTVALGAELPPARYVDNRGRRKVVRWWVMTVLGGAFSPNEEVDELRWLTPDGAAGLLTYAGDVELLGTFVEVIGPQ